jgi:hypothetical protein
MTDLENLQVERNSIRRQQGALAEKLENLGPENSYDSDTETTLREEYTTQYGELDEELLIVDRKIRELLNKEFLQANKTSL